MKLARMGVIAAAVLAVATMAFAQKPDFSGTWTLDAEASGAPAGGGGGGGGRGGGRGGLGQGGTVKQTATELIGRAHDGRQQGDAPPTSSTAPRARTA